MSYSNALNGPDRWSSCSNQDFAQWFIKSGHECLGILDRIDGNWGAWGAWGPCNKNSKRKRTRSCIDPPPSNGGLDCVGSSREKITCRQSETPQATFDWCPACPSQMTCAGTW